MVTINLLPWRERAQIYQREITKKVLLSTIFLALLVILMAYIGLLWLEKKANKEIYVLKNEIQNFANIKKTMEQQEKMNSKKGFIRDLYRYQEATRKLFAILEDKTEYEVCFTGILRKNNMMTFSGHASTALELTEFIKHWKATRLFSEIKVDVLEQTESHDMQFRFIAVEKESLVAEKLYAAV